MVGWRSGVKIPPGGGAERPRVLARDRVIRPCVRESATEREGAPRPRVLAPDFMRHGGRGAERPRVLARDRVVRRLVPTVVLNYPQGRQI